MILTEMVKSITAMRQRASNERYRRYAEAKSKLPKDLPPLKYQEEIRKLARKYKV